MISTFDEAHKQLETFATAPSTSNIPSIVSALLSLPCDKDPLYLRKWVRKIQHHFSGSMQEKMSICTLLLKEYDRQSALLKKPPGYSFAFFSEALFEDILGAKVENKNQYEHLSSILAAMKLYSSQADRIEPLLSPVMKEAITFYLHAHEISSKGKSSQFQNALKAIDCAYQEENIASVLTEFRKNSFSL